MNSGKHKRPGSRKEKKRIAYREYFSELKKKIF
jgi:hypothetical protein